MSNCLPAIMILSRFHAHTKPAMVMGPEIYPEINVPRAYSDINFTPLNNNKNSCTDSKKKFVTDYSYLRFQFMN